MNDAWQQASRLWANIGKPMRPDAEDLRVITDWLPDPALRKPKLRALVLGATQEYHALPWPEDVVLTAVDKSATMLGAIWPGKDRLCADWLALPLAAASVDLLLCDGGLCLQPYPFAQQALVSAAARVLAPGGLFIIRTFVPPARAESVEAVLADVLAGRLNRNLMRMRLWMAMQATPEAGVSNVASWQLAASAEPRVEKLAELLNADPDYLRAVLARPDERMYYFVDVPEILRMFCVQPGGFRLEETRVPAYPLGECCPTHVLRRL